MLELTTRPVNALKTLPAPLLAEYPPAPRGPEPAH